jgi:TolB-like protein
VEEVATKRDLENIITLIQQLGDRFDRRFDAVDRRFKAVENRLDRISDTLVGVQSQMAAMIRWADRFDREHSASLATQTAQQRAIDELAARIARLESRYNAS